MASGQANPHNQHNQQRASLVGHLPLGARARDIPLLANPRTPINFARRHNQKAPRRDDAGYGHYLAVRKVALANTVRELWESLSTRSPVERIDMGTVSLTVHYHSQSKLSQQELADLQKATHFDKKELQQWYKGRELQARAGEAVRDG